MSYRSNHSNINKDEGFFPSLKQSNNPRYQGVTQKGRFIPIGATSKDMQKGNDTKIMIKTYFLSLSYSINHVNKLHRSLKKTLITILLIKFINEK